MTIPIADYLDLVDRRQRNEAKPPRSHSVLDPIRSPIDMDDEVAAFLAGRFGREPVRAILAGCKARFGRDRTPSTSAAYRYWLRLRKLGHRNGPSVFP